MKKGLREVATKSEKELIDELSKKRDELFTLKMDVKQNKVKNTRSVFNSRKEIARIMTLLREKELAQGIAQTKQAETEVAK